MRSRSRLRLSLLALLVLTMGATACIGGGAEHPRADRTTPASIPSPSPTATADAMPTRDEETRHPVSLPTLMQQRFDGGGFRILRTVERTSAYTTSEIRYRGDGLTLTGLMLVPSGRGPFPVLVLNHGYIDPEVYRTGRGFERMQPYLARNGFAVVHIDYRNHAGSDRDPDSDLNLRLGYAADAITAVQAIRSSGLPYLDGERIGMIGRSMGGGVTFNALVAQPDIVDAAVVFASVSSNAVDNFDRWIRRRPELAQRIIETYGAPNENPTFWRDVSARTFFDRIEVPVMVHHGTADETCPIAWAEETVSAMRSSGVDVAYHRYPGEGHQLYAGYDRAMRRTIAFFREHLRAD